MKKTQRKLPTSPLYRCFEFQKYDKIKNKNLNALSVAATTDEPSIQRFNAKSYRNEAIDSLSRLTIGLVVKYMYDR